MFWIDIFRHSDFRLNMTFRPGSNYTLSCKLPFIDVQNQLFYMVFIYYSAKGTIIACILGEYDE